MQINVSKGSGKSIVAKLVMTGFGLFFAFIGTQFVRQEWKNLQEVKSMQDWVQHTCTIIQSKVEDEGEDFRLVIAYTYTVDGQTFEGNRYGRRNHYTAETIGEINQAHKRYAEGTRTQCFYDPEDIGNSVLTLPTIKTARTSVGLTMIFPVFGVLFASLPWLGVKRKKTAQKKKTESDRSSKTFLIIFGSVFALFGIVMIKPFLITPLMKTRDAQQWNTVPATVVSSKVKSHSNDDGTTYSVYIAYQYEVEGQEYYGDRYTFMGGSSSGYSSKAEIIRQYPKGHQFLVFVNQANPSESVIRREYSTSLLLGLIPLVFSLIGIVIIVYGIRNKPAALDMTQSHEHVVELKYSSPAKKAVGLSIFTLIWLAIVYFLAHSDAPLLFPIIFGFFGLILILSSIHAFLKIFTPKPMVEITPGNLQPGTRAAMRWRISGSTDRIDELTIKLRCMKVVTETRRRGGKSSSSVVKKPLFEHELLQTQSRFEIAQGTLQFTIPAEYPTSRPGNDNGIQWLVEFSGTISRWPDMQCELPFTVYPQG